ncbi:LysR Transcriptional regulator [Oxalobacteraceae bacterium]
MKLICLRPIINLLKCKCFVRDWGTIVISSDMLLAFVSVAQTLSVGRSAIELNVVKSIISKRIAQLERHLGVTLFSRSTRRIALTAAGEAYLEHAKNALAELAAGGEMMLSMRSELRGRIRLTAAVSWGQRVLCRLIPEFLKRHPDLEIDLVLADRLVDIAYERFDIALRWSASSSARDLVAYPVSKIDWMVTASQEYLAQFGSPDEPEELAHRSCLFYRGSSQDEWWSMSAGGIQKRIRVRSRYHVDNPEAVYEACAQGLGIAQLPDYLCDGALESGKIVRILPMWAQHTRFGNQITALVPPERMQLVRNRVFIEFLQQSLETAHETPDCT